MPEKEEQKKRFKKIRESKTISLIVVFFITYNLIVFAPLILSGPQQIDTSDISVSGTNPRLAIYGTTKFFGHLDGDNLYIGNLDTRVMILVNDSVNSFDIAVRNGIVHIVYHTNSYLYHREWDGVNNASSADMVFGPFSITDLNVNIAPDNVIYVTFTESSTAKLLFKSSSWSTPYMIPNQNGKSRSPSLVLVDTKVYFVWTDTREGYDQPYARSFQPGVGFGVESRICEEGEKGSGCSIGYYDGVFYVFTVLNEGIKAYIGSSITSITTSVLLIKHTGFSITYCSSSSSGLLLVGILGTSFAVKTLTSNGWGVAESVSAVTNPDLDATNGLHFIYTKATTIYISTVPYQTIETEESIPIDLTGGEDTVLDDLIIENELPLNEEFFERAELSDSVFAQWDAKLLESFPDTFEAIGEVFPFVTEAPTATLIITGILGTVSFGTIMFLPQFLYRRAVAKRNGATQEVSYIDNSFKNY